MRKRLLSLILAMCMVFSLVSAAAAAENPVTVTILGREYASQAADVFDLVNQTRADRGIAPVTRNATLSTLAMQRAAEIALYYSHTRPDGTDCFTILDGAYSGWYNCGENIAINQRSAEEVMEDWMNSQGHRENILSADFTQIGIGCFYSDGVFTWVQLFGNSTSDTAQTTAADETDVMVDVQILPSLLSVETLGAVDELEMWPGQTHTMIIDATNVEFVYSSPALIVAEGNATDENGTIIATRTVDPIDGSVVITAVNPGSAVMEIPVYAGQPDAMRINITVLGEEEPTTPPVEPQPTEPAPTEPQPTEPAPTEPAPTEPQPTEPDDDIIASGPCGAYAAWALDKDGTLTISGTGYMGGYSQKGAPWFPYADQIRHLVVEDGITGIGSYAFSHCSALVDVELPESIEYIDYCAFEYCTSLTSINLPQGITIIEAGCLRGCTSLTSLTIPNGVTYISDDAFGNCTGLQSIVIPDSVTSIEFNAFLGCPVTIYCYERSEAHMYAERNGYAFVVMEDEPGTPTYSFSIICKNGGTATVTPNPTPANRYVLFELAPDAGYVVDQIYYLCLDNPGMELVYRQLSDTQFLFLMPASDVELEVIFRPTVSPFKDVKTTDYFYEPVLWAVSYGITSGTGNGCFSPNATCTRAQVVTFLWRAAGEPEPVSSRNPFRDVKPSDYYYKAVLWAVENGITAGTSANKFSPSNPCTRAQVVTFLYRAAGEPGYPYNYNPFRDVEESAFYYDAVLWAVNYGITAGTSDTTFSPNSPCTRGQVVSFLYRFLA